MQCARVIFLYAACPDVPYFFYIFMIFEKQNNYWIIKYVSIFSKTFVSNISHSKTD